MSDYITQSEIATFNTCRTKHLYAYDEMQKLKKEAVHFHVGTAMHKWLEGYYEGVPLSLDGLSKDMLEETPLASADDLEDLNIAINNMKALVKEYPNFDPIKKYNLQVINVEHIFKVQVPHVQDRFIVGKIDVVCIDKIGRIWILDHKIMSKIDRSLIESFVLNQQIQTYLMGVRLDPKLSKYKVGGAIINLIRKPSLKQKETEGDDSFAKRVAVTIHDKPEDYFWSEQLLYEDSPNRTFEVETFNTIQEMRQPVSLGGRFINKNYSACVSVYGKCPFHARCADMPGWESYYKRKKIRHEELLELYSLPVSTVETKKIIKFKKG